MSVGRKPIEALVRYRTVGVCLVLALSTLAVYWPITRHEFTGYDDTDYVTQNAYVQAGLSAKSIAWAWHSDVARNWHPLTMLSHMLDCQLYGLNAGRHHLTSLLIHVTNTVLLFLILKQITGAFWRSGIVAALFALHPLHVESVAWVAERKDVLSTLFFLLTIGAYGRYVKCQVGAAKSKVQRPKAKVAEVASREAGRVTGTVGTSRITHHASRARSLAWLWYSTALCFFALGLMSKPMLVTLPFVLLLLDYWPLERLPWAGRTGRTGRTGRPSQPEAETTPQHPTTPVSRIGLEKIPFLALAAASCVVTFMVQRKGGAVLSVSNLPIEARVSNALVSYVRYLGKMVWPKELTALYLRKEGWPLWEVGLATLFLLAVSLMAIRMARRHGYLCVGWFWYLGTLVPVIGLVQVGMQTMADRYTYIPLIGIFIVLVWGGSEFANAWRVPRNALGVAAVLVLLACVGVTRAQLAYWRDGESLLLRMIAVNPGNYMAHYNLGNLYDRQNKAEEAIKHFEAAIASQPIYADAHCNLGGVLLRQRRYDEAISHYQTAAQLKPAFLNYFNLGNALADASRLPEASATYHHALELDPSSSSAHHNLGLVFQTQGKSNEAMNEFRAALRLQPDYESAEFYLANLLAEAGRLDEAIAHYLTAERLNPKHAETYNGLGICYAMQGKFPQAEQQLREAVRVAPAYAGAESNLANALGSQNKLEEAIPHYQKALAINPKDYQTHFNLALSLVRLGRAADAKAHLLEALRLQPDYPEARKTLDSLAASESKK